MGCLPDSAIVNCWGRQAAEAVQGYLQEARGNTEGVMSAMAAAELTKV